MLAAVAVPQAAVGDPLVSVGDDPFFSPVADTFEAAGLSGLSSSDVIGFDCQFLELGNKSDAYFEVFGIRRSDATHDFIYKEFAYLQRPDRHGPVSGAPGGLGIHVGGVLEFYNDERSSDPELVSYGSSANDLPRALGDGQRIVGWGSWGATSRCDFTLNGSPLATQPLNGHRALRLRSQDFDEGIGVEGTGSQASMMRSFDYEADGLMVYHFPCVLGFPLSDIDRVDPSGEVTSPTGSGPQFGWFGVTHGPWNFKAKHCLETGGGGSSLLEITEFPASILDT
ncbi:MAG TPA: hypothetical protein VMY88_06975 [Acidimicrobiales bacterium]|nr:hypothetical protein [Acidimicrobiales bacterium]